VSRRGAIGVAGGVLLGGAVLGCLTLMDEAAQGQEDPRGIVVDSGFWERWGDGKAELAGYDLTYPRYGELRHGAAIAITVTEPFSNEARVKADPGRHPDSDTFQVIKLNLIRDFPTGVYDYNLMQSVFVALEGVNGRPAGSPTKVSMTGQEWCGHVYHHLLFDEGGVREQLHSYFDGEGDRAVTLSAPTGGVSEDALWLWARGLAAPVLEPGQELEVPLLPSTLHTRLLHRPMEWTRATLSRESDSVEVTVPAGTFTCDVSRVTIEDGRTWALFVEREQPRRVVRWEGPGGEVGELLASERMPYWQLHDLGQEGLVERLGLQPRPPRTP
jgi:hypothetical protein